MTGIGIVIAEYDAGSRTHGASCTARAWSGIARDRPRVVLRRELGGLIPMLLSGAVSDIVASGERPFLLGGDHSLTYSSLEAVLNKFGHLRVVQFDAHHDAYESSLLNNYTVFHLAQRRMDISLHQIGVRHDGSGPLTLTEPVAGPTYVSVDVDYFSPTLVPEVMHAVPGPADGTPGWAEFAESMDMIGDVVAADIVEWCVKPGRKPSSDVVSQVFDLLATRLAQ